jgi:hypothetical protein
MGTPGVEGTRGEQGIQGYQGTQGYQGAQGYPGPVDLENYYDKDYIDSSFGAISAIIQEDEEVLANGMTAVNSRIDTLEGIVEEDEETLANALTGINGKFSGYDSSIARLDASMATTVQSSTIRYITSLTQAAYDAMETHDSSTFYIIQ